MAGLLKTLIILGIFIGGGWYCLTGVCNFMSDSWDRATDAVDAANRAKIQRRIQHGKRIDEFAKESPGNVSDARALVAYFRENELKAESEFKDAAICVRGIIGDIGKDIVGSPYVFLQGPENLLGGVQFVFDRDTQKSLHDLEVGDTQTICGNCQGYALGNVVLRESHLVKQ